MVSNGLSSKHITSSLIWVPLILILSTAMAQNPLGSCQRGRASNYNGDAVGACGYGDFRPTYTFAPNEAFYNGSNMCGACFEVTGVSGSQIYMAADLCPMAGNEALCSGDIPNFDIVANGFPILAPLAVGVTYTSIRQVVCPSNATNPYVGILISQGSGAISDFYIQAIVFNHRVPITAVSVSDGSGWTALNRSIDNTWPWGSDSTIVYPVTYSITSIYGETINVSLPSMPAPGQMTWGSAQFSQWPSISASDVCPSIYEFDIYVNGLNTGGLATTAENWGTDSAANQYFTDSVPSNATSALQKSLSGYEQWTIYTSGSGNGIGVSVSQIVAVQFQIWSSTNATGLQIVWSTFADNHIVDLPTVTSTWAAFYFSVTAFGSSLPDLDVLSIKNSLDTGVPSVAIANLRLVPASNVVLVPTPPYNFPPGYIANNPTSPAPPHSPSSSATPSGTPSSAHATAFSHLYLLLPLLAAAASLL